MNRSTDDEYAEAFRQGYERARRGFEPTARIDRAPLFEEAHDTTEPQSADRRRRTWLAAGGLVLAALLLVGAAFGAGRLVAGSGGAAATSRGQAVTAAGEASPTPYDGPVDAVRIDGASASCQSAASVDAAGTPVTYEPARVHDRDLSTAWRCPGRGRGQRLTLALPPGAVVAEVGLVPGYAKTDPASGEDRYAQNNRITRVRWHFDDGSSLVQRVRGVDRSRGMRTMRVPSTATGSVELEILASKAGPRNTVAISEVRVAGPAG